MIIPIDVGSAEGVDGAQSASAVGKRKWGEKERGEFPTNQP